MTSTASTGDGAILDAPPTWHVGDWWRLRVTNHLLGTEHTVTQVVASFDGLEYRLGAPEGELDSRVFIFHVPAYGPVRPDLSQIVHYSYFEPVKFPIRAGDSWSTHFEDEPVQARVARVEGAKAWISVSPSSPNASSLSLVYDATLGTFARVDVGGTLSYEVEARGGGYACAVDVPTLPYHVFSVGRYHDGRPEPVVEAPVRVVTIDASVDRVAYTILLSSPGDGVVGVRVTTPDGTVREDTLTPSDAPGLRLSVFESADPAGAWRIDRVAVGQGFAITDGLAYRVETLPLGAEDARGGDDCVAEAAPRASGAPVPEPREADAFPFAWRVALSTLGVAMLGALAVPRVRHAVEPFVLAPLYSMIRPEVVLDHPVRRRIVDLLRATPGLTTQEIRRRLEIGWGSAMHHLTLLERHRVLTHVQWGRHRDWFVIEDLDPLRRVVWSALRRPPVRAVFEAIRTVPGISQQELARQLGVHHGTVIFHAGRLEQAQLIRSERAGGHRRYWATA